MITLASMVISRTTQIESLLHDGILTLPIWVLIFGIAITMIGFFGCCGALKESQCLLYTVSFSSHLICINTRIIQEKIRLI